jgi:hypothetical protein
MRRAAARWPRRGAPWLFAGAVALLPLAAAAATVPAWLAAALANPSVPRNANVAAIALLNDEQVRYLTTDRVRRRWQGAVKVVTSAGFNLSPVILPYNAGLDRIVSARAWVVSADGRATKAFGQADFTDQVTQLNKYFWDSQRAIRFDGGGRLEVGGVLAWEIEVESPSGVFSSDWTFASALDVVRGRFEVIPPPGGVLQWHATTPQIGAPRPGAEPGALEWEVTNQLPFATGRPVGFIPNPRTVSVRCLAGGSPSPPTTWTDQSRLAAGVMDPRIDSSGEVKTRAEALVTGRPGRWERIRALAEFAQHDIVYLAITLDQDYLAGMRPHPAAEVLRHRYGDCKDKATLLVSLLRAIGEDGYVVLVNAGDPARTSEAWPTLFFNHAIVALRADAATPADWPVVDAGSLGKLVIFDPTDSSTPLGLLSPADQGGFALLVAPLGGPLLKLPVSDPASNLIERTSKAGLGPQGDVQVSVVEDYRGWPATQVHGARFGLGAGRFRQGLESRVHAAAPLAQDLHWSDDWDPVPARYRLAFDFRSDRYARPMGEGLLLVSPRILAEGTALLPWRTAAEGIVWLPSGQLEEEVRLSIPPDYAVEEMPENWTQEAPAASGKLSYRLEGREIAYRCRFRRRGGFYGRADYEALRLFEQQMLQAERRPVLLRQGAAPVPVPAGT